MALSFELGFHSNSGVHFTDDGYYYHINKQVEDTIYFKCFVAHCNARGIMRSGVFERRYDHCHEPCIGYVDYLRRRRSILDAASALDVVDTRDVMNRNIGLFEDILTYDRLRLSLSRARLSSYPTEPRTLAALADILENPLYKSLSQIDNTDDTLYSGSILIDDGSIILLMSKRCCEIIRWTPSLHAYNLTIPIRGTTNSFELHIIGTVLDATSLPLAFILLERSTVESYVRVFSRLRHQLVQFAFMDVYCNEGVQAEAYRLVFGVNVSFSLHHFICDLKKMARTIMQDLNQDHQSTVHIFNLMCGLPMVPQDLLSDAMTVTNLEINRANVDLQHCLTLILLNIENQWLKSPHRGPQFSLCGNLERTSNTVELTEERLRRKLINHGDTGLYSFLDNLKRIEGTAFDDSVNLGQTQRPRGRRVSSLSTDPEIINLTRTLTQLPGTLSTALTNLMLAGIVLS